MNLRLLTGDMRLRYRSVGVIAFTLIAFAVVGCASIDRLPAVPYSEAGQTEVMGIPDARFYVSERRRIDAVALEALKRRNKFRAASAPQYILAISGGGDDGAFGAGVLVGWSARGDRPMFDVVTGVSTGSLSAPFAFLGPEYDDQLKEIYTDTNANDVFHRRPLLLSAAAGDALLDSAPLRKMIARHMDDAMVRRIAEEYKKGRLLFVLTTNLDQARPVIWNIGAIAASGSPRARDLIIDILLASASMPAIFPPVMIDVSVNGRKYQEMHVDGGTIAQAFLYPPSFSLKQAAALARMSERKFRARRRRIAYIIRNGRLSRPQETVKLQTLAIAKEAISTMIASSGVNDTYRMYLITKRDGVQFNLASIGADFTIPYKGPFNEGYMRALFDYGYQKARAGYPWQKTPPGYAK
jgi:predicted patatin/cPLA2 family phospholipase